MVDAFGNPQDTRSPDGIMNSPFQGGHENQKFRDKRYFPHAPQSDLLDIHFIPVFSQFLASPKKRFALWLPAAPPKTKKPRPAHAQGFVDPHTKTFRDFRARDHRPQQLRTLPTQTRSIFSDTNRRSTRVSTNCCGSSFRHHSAKRIQFPPIFRHFPRAPKKRCAHSQSPFSQFLSCSLFVETSEIRV